MTDLAAVVFYIISTLSCDMSCQERFDYVKYVSKIKVENTSRFNYFCDVEKCCFKKKRTTKAPMLWSKKKIMNSIVQEIHPTDVCNLKVHIFLSAST